jgi:hypothetical protein
MSWYNENWQHRFKITSDNTKVSASIKGLAYDLSNAPAGFWSKVKSDGADIRITKGDGTTEVARDVISIDTTAETGLIRFDTGDISTSSDEDYYLYYDNASASDYSPGDTYGRETVWSDTLVVWRPNGSGTFLDASGNHSISSTSGTITEEEGLLGPANFIAPSAEAMFSTIGQTVPFSIISVIKTDGSSNTKNIMSDGLSSGAIHNGIEFGITDDNGVSFQQYGGACSGAGRRGFFDTSQKLITNDWNQVVITATDINTMSCFINNAEATISIIGDKSTPITYSTISGLGVGASSGCGAASRQGNKSINYLMMVNRIVTSDEVSTLFNNEADNSTFWTTGTEEDQTIISFTITTLTPTNITFNSVTLRGEIEDFE